MKLIHVISIPLLLPIVTYIYNRLSIFGLFRYPTSQVCSYALDDEYFVIKGPNHCEDIEYIPELSKIYAACQGNVESRYKWWPAWNVLYDPEAGRQADGQIWEVDVKVCQTKIRSYLIVVDPQLRLGKRPRLISQTSKPPLSLASV
jgi:hypothetical protein